MAKVVIIGAGSLGFSSKLTSDILTYEPVFERDPERVFQAMMMDPLTAMSCTPDQIRAMTIELLEAHREFTPILKGKSLAPNLINS